MLVFVYGTLTDPAQVAAVLEPEECTYEFVGHATLEGVHRVDGRYPTLAPGRSVVGRLLEVDERGLEALDAYEGVDSGLYVRCELSGAPPSDADPGGKAANEVTESVWVYVGAPARLGLEEQVRWPGEGSFRSQISETVSDLKISRLSRE